MSGLIIFPSIAKIEVYVECGATDFHDKRFCDKFEKDEGFQNCKFCHGVYCHWNVERRGERIPE